MNELRGTGVAIVTPFNVDFSIDFSSLEKLINHLIEGGINYLVPLGTTGESATLSKEEKTKIFNFVIEINNNRIPLVAGMGGNNTAELVEGFKKVDKNKFLAILSVSPYYNKPNQEGIFRHYKSLSQVAPLPIILYNVPGRTGSNIIGSTTLKLAKEFKNIIGIKEASGNFDQFMSILKHKPKDFMVISGDDGIALPMIALGAEGVISVVANAYPKEFSTMIQHCLKNNFEEAKLLHYKFSDLINMLFEEGSPGGIKYVLSKLNICKTEVREPLYGISDALKGRIDLEIMNYGL